MELKHLLIKYKKFLKTDNLSTNTIETYLGDIDVYLNYIGFDSEFTKDDSFERLFSEQNLEDYFESIISSDKYKNREALNVKLKRTLNRKMSSFAKLLSFLVREKKISTNFVHTFDRSRFMGNIVRSDDFKKHFFGTHFFNPPRYLKLLEIIPTPETSKEDIDFMMGFGYLIGAWLMQKSKIKMWRFSIHIHKPTKTLFILNFYETHGF